MSCEVNEKELNDEEKTMEYYVSSNSKSPVQSNEQFDTEISLSNVKNSNDLSQSTSMRLRNPESQSHLTRRNSSIYSIAQATDSVLIGFDKDYITDFEDKMYIQGPQSARKYVNFFALLFFATVIATYALLSSSTASVIGAMIVAPLMGPIMGTTAGIIQGHFKRATIAFMLVCVGIGFVILVAWVLTLFIPDVLINFETNSELIGRINPDLLSLLCALGSGGAGAFILCRPEIADSMGGVAIAISLVPPLCTVGIALRVANYSAAAGAMLLFVTNLAAIFSAGGFVFLIIGLGRVKTSDKTRFGMSIRWTGFFVFLIAVGAVAFPLTVATLESIQNFNDVATCTNSINDWANQNPPAYYTVSDVTVKNSDVFAVISGAGNPGSLQTLATTLSNQLGRTVVVTLDIISSFHSDRTVPIPK